MVLNRKHFPAIAIKNLEGLGEPEIWNQLRAGNQLAFEYFYRRYAEDLFNFGMKLYGRQHWVQDTLHELYVEIWSHHHKLSSVSSVKTYLFKAFKYKLNRQYGKEKFWKYKEDYKNFAHLEVELPAEQLMISTQLSDEKKVKLALALEKLPARQKEALHLLFDEECSYEEVAEIMDINIRSVYTIAWKGINSLRKQITDLIFLLIPALFLLYQMQ